MTNQPKPAPTAEEQLPPIPCGKPHNSKYWDEGIEWAIASERAVRMEREDQLTAALRSNREKDAQLAELIVNNRKLAEISSELQNLVDEACTAGESDRDRANAAEAQLAEKDAKIADLEQRLATWEPRESAELGGSV